MTSRRFRIRPPGFMLAVIAPFAVGVALNAVIRPGLAHMLGGTVVRRGASVRGSDRWWEFDAATSEAHPLLTDFLSTSDGAVSILMFLAIGLLFLWRWLDRKLLTPRAPGTSSDD